MAFIVPSVTRLKYYVVWVMAFPHFLWQIRGPVICWVRIETVSHSLNALYFLESLIFMSDERAEGFGAV